MSSFSSGASLRRRCIVQAGDTLVCAHGPFLEAFPLSACSQHAPRATHQPARLKIFSDLGVVVESVVACGTSEVLFAISAPLLDPADGQFKLYANLVLCSQIRKGGYANAKHRFVLFSAPSHFKLVLGVHPDTLTLIVNTGHHLALWDWSIIDDDTLHLDQRQNCIDVEKNADVSPPQSFFCNEFGFMTSYCNSSIVNFIDEFRCYLPMRASTFLHVAQSAVQCAHLIADMTTAIIADLTHLYLLRLHENAKPDASIQTIDKYETFPVPGVRQIETAVDWQGKRRSEATVVTLSPKQIIVWTLTACSFTQQVAMDAEGSGLFSSCALFTPPQETRCSVGENCASPPLNRAAQSLAIIYENGDVKLVDPFSYRAPSMSILPMHPSENGPASEIISFVPFPMMKGGDPRVDSYFALTTKGEFIFRRFNGPKQTPAHSRVIAREMRALCATMQEESGERTMVAYGDHRIHVQPYSCELPNVPTSIRLETTSKITRCFAHSDHFIVIAGGKIALVALQPLEEKKKKMVGLVAGVLGAPPSAESISSYGGMRVDGEGEDEEAASLVLMGTDRGRLYSMRLNPSRMTKHDSLQKLLDAPYTETFQFEESLSSLFVELSEDIVSVSGGRKDIIVMGFHGSILRCRYTKDRELVVMERSVAPFLPNVHCFISLVRLSHASHNLPLMVLHQIEKHSGYRAFHLIDVTSREKLFSVDVNRFSASTLEHIPCNMAHAFEVLDGGANSWEREIILLVHATPNLPTTQGAKDCSVIRFSGRLKARERDQFIATSIFNEEMRALYTHSFTNEEGVRSTRMLGVGESGLTVVGVNASGKLRRVARLEFREEEMEGEKNGEKERVVPTCSRFFSISGRPFLLTGYCDGRVLMTQPPRPGKPLDTISNKQLLKEELKILQVAPFEYFGKQREMDDFKLLLALLTEKHWSVYLLNHPSAGDSVKLIEQCPINMSAPPVEYTLFAMGGPSCHHDIWLCSRDRLLVWSGKERQFISQQPTVVEFSSRASALCALSVSRHSDHFPFFELLFLGNQSGQLTVAFTKNMRKMDKTLERHFPPMQPLEGVGEEVKALSASLAFPLELSEGSAQFSSLLYILTARRVIIKCVRFSYPISINSLETGMIFEEKSDELFHLIRHPTLLSIERPLMIGSYMISSRHPLRLSVFGGGELEMLLLCPKRLRQLYAMPLEVVPRSIRGSEVVQGSSEHFVMNNTCAPILFRVSNGEEERLEGTCSRRISIKWDGSEERVKLRWRMEEDEGESGIEEREKRCGEITIIKSVQVVGKVN